MKNAKIIGTGWLSSIIKLWKECVAWPYISFQVRCINPNLFVPGLSGRDTDLLMQLLPLLMASLASLPERMWGESCVSRLDGEALRSETWKSRRATPGVWLVDHGNIWVLRTCNLQRMPLMIIIDSWSFMIIHVHPSSHLFMHSTTDSGQTVHLFFHRPHPPTSPGAQDWLSQSHHVQIQFRPSKMSPNWVLLPLRDPALLLCPWWKAMKHVMDSWTGWKGNILSIYRRYHIWVYSILH